MSTAPRGFTLIELMIVIAIIGVLAVIAVPTYQTYTTRATVGASLAWAASYEAPVSEYYTANGVWPNLGSLTSAAGNDTLTTPDGVLSITGGTISVTLPTTAWLASSARNTTLTLTPYADATGAVLWACATSTPPSGFAAVTSGAPATNTVPSKYLPSICHS